ncbi:MAG: hypothetical protein LUO93_08730 [Methanomicrobiales archaeon]|nr:hypothetical protein [Methanomicrobiales archaeon]
MIEKLRLSGVLIEMVFGLSGVLKTEKTEDPLHREATLLRLHGLVIRQVEENPSRMQEMGQKIIFKVGEEWEWWKSDSLFR